MVLMSALHPAEQRAGVLWGCPERYKIELALAHDGQSMALGAGHMLLPVRAATDGGFLQGNFINPSFYWFASMALILLRGSASPQTQ